MVHPNDAELGVRGIWAAALRVGDIEPARCRAGVAAESMLPADADFGHRGVDPDGARDEDADAQNGRPLARKRASLEPVGSRFAGEHVCVENGPEVVDEQQQVEDQQARQQTLVRSRTEHRAPVEDHDEC